MATKTTKKSTTRATTAKKPAVKKPAPKKSTTKAASVKTHEMATPVIAAAHNCHCGGECHCGADCKCGTQCKCHHHGCAHFIKHVIIALIMLAIGFVAGANVNCHKGPRGPHIKFASNGCLVEESVKCPKLMEALPAMDINQDGCITREEFHMVKQQMRREVREIPVEVAE